MNRIDIFSTGSSFRAAVYPFLSKVEEMKIPSWNFAYALFDRLNFLPIVGVHVDTS